MEISREIKSKIFKGLIEQKKVKVAIYASFIVMGIFIFGIISRVLAHAVTGISSLSNAVRGF